MGLDDFLDELDRRGADLPAWPAASRDAATSLLAADPRASKALAALAEAEAWLAETRVAAAAVSPSWVGAVARLPQVRPGMMGAVRTRRALALGAAAACLVGGVVIGAAPHFTPEPSEVLAGALNGSAGVFDAG